MSVSFIDGKAWAVCMPSGGQAKTRTKSNWDQIMTATKSDESGALYSRDLFTICRDLCLKDPEKCIVRGYKKARNRELVRTDKTYLIMGFRPMMIPLNNTTLLPDQSLLSQTDEFCTLGSLYMNDQPVQYPKWYQLQPGQMPKYASLSELHIGDSDPDLEKCIHWYNMKTYLIAERVILVNVSWEDLDRNGFTIIPEGWQ